MKRYFSAESAHGSSSSYGFANDTIVYVFSNKKSRDNYVSNNPNISCKAIKASDATKQATTWSLVRNEYNKPNPFTGEFWGIVETEESEKIDGCIGAIEICTDERQGKRFYD